MAQLGFTADDYDPRDDFEPLPAGSYVTMITEASVQPTKSGGQMVKLSYTVMDGQYQGRKIWSNHNIINNNPRAEEIGRKEISRIAHALNFPKLADTDQLVNKVVQVTVIIKSDPGYSPKNEVKKWEGVNTGQAPAYQQQPPQQAAQPQYQQAPPPHQEYIPANNSQHPADQHSAPPWKQQ